MLHFARILAYTYFHGAALLGQMIAFECSWHTMSICLLKGFCSGWACIDSTLSGELMQVDQYEACHSRVAGSLRGLRCNQPTVCYYYIMTSYFLFDSDHLFRKFQTVQLCVTSNPENRKNKLRCCNNKIGLYQLMSMHIASTKGSKACHTQEFLISTWQHFAFCSLIGFFERT